MPDMQNRELPDDGIAPRPNIPPANTNVGPIITSKWVLLGAAIFGLITLLCFIAFAYLAFFNAKQACEAYRFLAPVFALGLGLATAFVGGNAVATGNLRIPGVTSPIIVGLGGGVAVVIVAFGVFNYLLPQCEIRSTKVLIKDVPTDVFIHVMYPNYSRRNESNLVYDFDILPDTRESQTFSITATQEGRDKCKLYFVVTDDIDSEMKNRQANYGFTEFRTATFALEYDNPPIQGNTTKETLVSCTKWHTQPSAVYNLVLISPNERRAAVATKVKKPDLEVEETALPSYGTSGNFSIMGSAFAADQEVPFEKIVVLLKSPDDSTRVAARRYLAQSFKTYALDVMTMLRNSTVQSDPGLLADLLSALIEGMGAEDPSIVPGKGKKAGGARDFSGALPFVSGFERMIVELTGFADTRVKKQARRLVQRYPFDSFMAIYDELVRNSVNCSAVALLNEKEQAQLYSSLFFYYNRIIDHNYSASLTDAALKDARDNASKAIAASKCLPLELRVDAAVVHYGLAVILAEDKGTPRLEEAKIEAQKFLSHVSGMETRYYLLFHVEEMRRRADIAPILN